MTEEVKSTTRGMVMWSLAFAAAIAFIVLACMGCFSGWKREHTEVLLGFAVGAGLACFMTVHMAKALTVSVEMDEVSALKHTKKQYAIRTGIVFAAVIGLYFTGWFNILAMLGGLFCLKPAAYMQMFFQKNTYTTVCSPDIIEENDEKEEEEKP